jgi:hypothetical protein
VKEENRQAIGHPWLGEAGPLKERDDDPTIVIPLLFCPSLFLVLGKLGW